MNAELAAKVSILEVCKLCSDANLYLLLQTKEHSRT